MKIRRPVVSLWLAIALLALPATLAGLLSRDGQPSVFTTIRGDTVSTYGRGLYARDSLFVGAGNKSTDLVTLVIAVPVLVITTMRYQRGSIRGGLLLLGVLAYFLYVYMGYALGTTFLNGLFFVSPAGYLLAVSLLVLVTMLAP